MDCLRFIEFSEFMLEVEAVAGHDAFLRLQNELIARPYKGDLIQGTGGLRKVRLALKGGGKSGGARVIYST